MMPALYGDHRKVLRKRCRFFFEAFGACGLTIFEKKTEVMTMPTPRIPVEKMRIEAAGQQYNQTDSFAYLGGTVSETPDVSGEISRRTRACWVRVKKYAVQLYNRPTVPLDLKARMVKADAVEALLYGSVTWTLRQEHYKLTPRALQTYAKSTTNSSAPYTTVFCYVSSGSTVDCGTTVSSRTAKHYMRSTAKALRWLPGREGYCRWGRLCGWMPDRYSGGSSWGNLTA